MDRVTNEEVRQRYASKGCVGEGRRVRGERREETEKGRDERRERQEECDDEGKNIGKRERRSPLICNIIMNSTGP